jgi:hypothetical protein
VPRDVGAPVVAPVGSRAVHRLRDLHLRGRLVALVLALALTAPFVASVAKAVALDWTPSNDEALITLRVRDVLAGELPLIGQPSTAELYADSDPPHHPGPIEFYLLVPPVALLGSDLGVLVGAAAINLSAVLVAAWVVFRRAGPAVGVLGAVVLSAIAWSEGLAVLTDPISSNMGGIPMLALAALAWAVVDGDLRLLPLAALAYAFVCQQHLAVVGVATGTAAWAGVGLMVAALAWRRHRSAADAATTGHRGPATEHAADAPTGGRTDASADDPAPVLAGGSTGGASDGAVDGAAGSAATSREGVRTWPWVVGGAVVSAVAWLPVVVDQVAGTGNLGRMVSFARSSDRPSLGLGSGIRQGLRSVGAPPLILRTNLTGDDIHQPLAAPTVVVALLVVLALVAIAVVDRRRRPARAALAATALVVAVLGAVNGANVPDSVEAGRINFYRWAFVASALTWLVLAWAGGALVRRRWSPERGGADVVHVSAGDPVPESAERRGVELVRSYRRSAGPVLVAAALVAVVGMSVAAIAVGGPQRRRDQQIFRTERLIADRLDVALEGRERVLIVPEGRSALLALGPSVALHLVEGGHRIGVSADQEAGYGDHLVADGRTFDAGVVVASGKGSAPPGPGRVVAHVDLNAKSRAARAELARGLRGADLEPGPRSEEIIRELVGGGARAYLFAINLGTVSEQPEVTLQEPLVARALRAGYFGDAPIDHRLLDAIIDNPYANSWNDDVIEVRVLTPAQIREHYADLVD